MKDAILFGLNDLINELFQIFILPQCRYNMESIICVLVGYKNLSLGITVCLHSSRLVMPDGDPRDEFFYPTLTPMIDS